MQGLDDLCGQCESLLLIAVVSPAYNPAVTSQLLLPNCSDFGPALTDSKHTDGVFETQKAVTERYIQSQILDGQTHIPERMNMWLLGNILTQTDCFLSAMQTKHVQTIINSCFNI